MTQASLADTKAALVSYLGSRQQALSDPPSGAYAVTPSNTDLLPTVIRAFEVTTAGNVAVVFLDGTEITLLNRQAGQRYSGFIKQIKVTGTTATGIVGYT